MLYLGAALAVLPVSFRGGSARLRKQRGNLLMPAGAVVFGGLSYGVSIVLYIKGAQHLGATRSQILFSASPFLGGIFAWTFLGEPVLAMQLVAAAVMIAALYLLMTARHEHGHTHERMAHTHNHRHDDEHHRHIHPNLPPWIRYTHELEHEELEHTHPHEPDLHHRHEH